MANLLDSERRLGAALLARSETDLDRAAEPPPPPDDELVGADGMDQVIADLDRHPEEVLAFTRRLWDRDLTAGELREALVTLRTAMELAEHDDPREIAAALPLDLRNLGRNDRAAGDLTIGPTKLPDGWWPNQPQIGVKVDPASYKFETDRDWTGWGWHTAGGWLGANLIKLRADFRVGEHDYTMPASNGFKLGLFSDFGTGLYHSQYIAHFLGTRRPDLAIHLGDVYYAGKQEEFDAQFEGVLNTHLFAQSPSTKLFCLNANHEMYARARPYFRYLDRLRGANRSPQEGSYFRIRIGQRFQVVAIDSACTLKGKIADGRFADRDLHDWLSRRLEEGKREGRATIFLSSDYPYHVGGGGKTKLLEDLEPYVQRGLIDAWFWGDSHYGALFFRGPRSPFIGGCLGHGGYPYYKREIKDSAKSLAAPRFVEYRTRFYGTGNPGIRPDMGNNGFAFLTLDDSSGEAVVEYIDWRNESRVKERLVRGPSGLDFQIGGTRSLSLPSERSADRSVDRAAASKPPCPCHGAEAEAPDTRAAAPPRRSDDERMARALRSTHEGGAQKIVGGAPVSSLTYPSCVMLALPGRDWQCSGVLVAPQVILTAAHCTEALVEALVGGSKTPERGGTDGTVMKLRGVRVHRDNVGRSEPGVPRHDIAVAILDQPATVQHVKLATDDELAAATDVRLVGYGRTDKNSTSAVGELRMVEVAIGPVKTRPDQDHFQFEKAHGYDADTEFVAGRKRLGKDTCQGDSGGPAYIWTERGFRLAGLTSRGTKMWEDKCGDGGIYVRPLKYVDWIAEVCRSFGITWPG